MRTNAEPRALRPLPDESLLESAGSREISGVGTGACAAVVQHVGDPVVFARGHRYRGVVQVVGVGR